MEHVGLNNLGLYRNNWKKFFRRKYSQDMDEQTMESVIRFIEDIIAMPKDYDAPF